MTRKSKREIEREVENLEATGEADLQEYLWADLKNYHEGSLTHSERQILADPETHLSPLAYRTVVDQERPQ